MTSCRHHSGYLADDEAGHTTYLARPPKKPAFPEMRQASKLGHMPHPPSKYSPSSALHKHHRNWRDPRPFGTFLDFLVKGQVLDSLQTVVDKATERIATMKTEAGVPLVEVQDPVEVPAGGRRVRARPSLSTMHRHLVRPSLCTGNPNNYPSCSSSMSDSHSNFTAGWHGSHSRDSDLGYNGLGPLPPMKDKLLQEKSLKRLLQLENRGKSLGQFCSQRDSLLWDSMGSQSSSQWTPEHPLLGFSSLLGSSLGTPEASELGPGKRELIFLKQEFNKEINSLLSQPASLDLPGYCSLREPHRTLDFLAEHHLFPALQRVVSQAVDKLSGACLHNGCPLFPSEWEPTTKPNLNSDSNSEVTPDSKWATTDQGEERYDYPLPTTASSLRMVHRKSTKSRGWDKPKEDVSSMSSDQEATRIRLKVIPTEKPKIPSPHYRQEAPDQDPKVQKPPMSTSGALSSKQRARPWRRLHLILPAPGIKVEVPLSQTRLTQVPAPHASPCPLSSHHLPVFSPLTSLVRSFSSSLTSLHPKMSSSKGQGLRDLGAGLQGNGPFSHQS
uniref:Coiled-coil domain containing 116 n=1 Tax=Rhinolophus ferrumequinum TaxID=59479 RepID=A0A671FX85_RHIFE